MRNNYNVCKCASFIQFMYMCFIHSVRHYVLCILESASCNSVYCRGGSREGGGAPGERPPPPKFGKNMIFWRKIVIFHTKYPNNFRASLRSAPPPNLKSWIRPCTVSVIKVLVLVLVSFPCPTARILQFVRYTSFCFPCPNICLSPLTL